MLIDKHAILQCLGCIMKKPSLLEEYTLTQYDFEEEQFYAILFSCVYNLYNQGVEIIDTFAIDSFLSRYEKQYKIFNDNQGIDYCDDAIRLAELENFSYYLERLKKFSLLRYWDSCGVDIRNIYDQTIIDPSRQEQQAAKLDATSINDMILEEEDLLITKAKMLYGMDSSRRGQLAGKGMKELKERLKEEPEFGIPLQSPMMTTIARGARHKKVYLRSADSGGGKAIPNDTLIPTPFGKRRVGDIKIGDYLFDRKGEPTKVIGVYPQPKKKKIFEVTFSDGRIARCCDEHLWSYYNRWDSHTLHTSSLREIINKGIKRGKAYDFRVPVNEAVDYPEKQFSIPPYIMGLLLGDGSFRYNKTNKALSYSSEDNYLPKKIGEIMNWKVKKNPSNNYSYYFEYSLDEQIKQGHENVWVEEVLKDFSGLWQKKSHEKYIPDIYLVGSIEQRRELLCGLLDTDGNVEKEKGRVTFSTTSPAMVEGFEELCHSLGIVVGIVKDKRTKYTTDVAYKVTIQTDPENKLTLFKLPKHINKIKDYFEKTKGKAIHKNKFISIVDIRETDEYVDMTCFTVDNDEHLFLMNDFIVTHNTRTSIADICNFSIPYFYDTDKKEWIYTGCEEPSLFISTELEEDEVQTIIMAYVSGVPENKILDGDYEGDEEERVDKAIEYIATYPLYIEIINDFGIEDISNIIKTYKREKGCHYFVFDYIHMSAKLIAEVASMSKGMKLREDQTLFLFMDTLKNLAMKLDIFILTMTQLNGTYKDSQIKDETMLRGAKSLADRIDLGEISLRPTSAELECVKKLMHNMYGVPIPNLVRHIYKVRRGKLTKIRLWQYADLSTGRTKDLFITDNYYNLIETEVAVAQIEKVIEEHSESLDDIQITDDEQQEATSTLLGSMPFDF